MRTPKDVTLQNLLAMALEVDSDLARSIPHMSHAALLTLSVDPSLYKDHTTFAKDLFLASYVSKYTGLNTGIDTYNVALTSWMASEESCRITNEHMNRYTAGQESPLDPAVSEIILLAKRKIASVLGPFSHNNIRPLCSWTTGSTSTLKRRDAQLHKKLSEPLSVTRAASPYFRAMLNYDLNWFRAFGADDNEPLDFKGFAKSSVMMAVPKSAKTDRMISKEPTLNMFLQKGVGTFIRKRLKGFGIDLDDQSINQKLARKAFTCDLATLDLKAASDSISKEVVYALLPLEWASYMDDIRTKSTVLDSNIIALQKFSSMGNGFTFELESLIFFGLVWAVCSYLNITNDIGIYGDDIIIDRRGVSLLTSTFSYLGFSLNNDKSFVDGSFFESCGGQYFDGWDVTPVYQKKVVDSPFECILASNRLFRWMLRVDTFWLNDISVSCRSRLTSLFIKLNKGIKNDRRLPAIHWASDGDDGFLSRDLSFRPYDCNHGYYCCVYQSKVSLVKIPERYHHYLYAYKLRTPAYENDCPRGQPKFSSGNMEFRIRYKYYHTRLDY